MDDVPIIDDMSVPSAARSTSARQCHQRRATDEQ
jgi:hypothetical protein